MPMFVQRIHVSLLAMMIACCGLLLAQSTSAPANSGGSGATKIAPADQTFLRKAAQGGTAEVELGKVAQQNGGSDQVKQFGERMVADHTTVNDTLKQLAASKGVSVPAQPDSADQREKARLQKLKGAQFDRAYFDYMVRDHQKDVSEFRKEANSAKDPDVKAFAQQTLPTLEEHLKMAQQAQKNLKASSGASGTSTSASSY